MLLKIECQGLAYGLLNGTGYLAVTQLGLGLTFKLRLGNLY